MATERATPVSATVAGVFQRSGAWFLVGIAALVCVVVPSSETLRKLRAGELPYSAELVLRSWSHTVLSPWFWAFVVIIVLLERLLPARIGEGTWSIGAAHDLVWFILFTAFQLTIVRAYYRFLSGLYHDTLHGPSIQLAAVLGTVGAAAFAFVVTEFLDWASHVVRHRVPAFWRFHEIHHSQQSMNMFTNERVHFVEVMIMVTFLFLPQALLGIPAAQAAAIATVALFYERFFHANIRTNLGPLRFVLVTPQSHRIHHATRPDYFDTNFGAVFSFWDRLFRTQHPDDSTFPAVGVAGSAVPLERSARPHAMVATYARQLAYPFRPHTAPMNHAPER